MTTRDQFFMTVDVIDILLNEQKKVMNELTGINDEIRLLAHDLEDLILAADYEYRDSAGETFCANIRVFTGLGEEKRNDAAKLLTALTSLSRNTLSMIDCTAPS